MKRTLFLLSLLVCVSLAASAANPYAKAIRKNLQIEHVFSRPTTAYGPGTVVIYEKKSGYTGVCLPEWIIGNEQPRIDSIADIMVKKNATISFKIELNAQDRIKVGAEYKDISDVTLDLKNGHQAEIFTDLAKAFIEIGKGVCGGNCKELLKANPKSKFYFVRVGYAYDLDIKFKRESGAAISGAIPEEVLKVVAAKIGFDIKSLLDQSMSGKSLYIGFNGTPTKIAYGINQIKKRPSDISTIMFVDVTELIR